MLRRQKMSVELKIKSKHLSEEARIIRFEENKIKRHSRHVRNRQGHVTADEVLKTYHSLNHHRRWDVRNENRATFLARAYIAGVPYNQAEQKRKEENEFTFLYYILPRVASMVAKYGDKKIQKKVWEGSYPNRKEVDNPEFIQLQKDIQAWSKI
jgi:hypothetical protein